MANVTPVFKKGSRSTLTNYRPISLTSLPCKIFESILKEKIVEHLDTHRLLNDSQHGFISHKSCTSNLLEYLEFVTNAIDSGQNVDSIYLDFSKSFDKVPHKRLLLKLCSFGISGKILKWISEWLQGRMQRVVASGYKSSWANVLSGVPQGSVLGPLLFIMYINDLDSSVKCGISKFADDTKIFQAISSEDGHNTLQLG